MLIAFWKAALLCPQCSFAFIFPSCYLTLFLLLCFTALVTWHNYVNMHKTSMHVHDIYACFKLCMFSLIHRFWFVHNIWQHLLYDWMLKNHPSGHIVDCFRGIHTLIFSGSAITSLCVQNFITDVYIGIMEVRDSCPKISPKTSLYLPCDIYSRQYTCRLGIAKLKNIFRSFLTHSKQLLRNLKNFLFSWIFYWLTYLCLKTTGCNSIMAIATVYRLDFFTVLRFSVRRYTSFCQSQPFQCLHHGSTKAHLCSPLYSITFSLTV